MVRRVNILIIMIFAMSVYTNSATYYVSKSGSDANSGLSWAQAWLTVGKVNSSAVGGDTVFFGTGIWREMLNPIAGSYGDQTTYACSSFALGSQKAQIYGSDRITGWTRIGSSNVYIANYSSAITLPTLWQDTTWLYGQADSASVNVASEWWIGNGHIIAYVNGGNDPDNYDMEMTQRNVVSLARSGLGSQDHVTLWGLSLKYGDDAALRIGYAPLGIDSLFIEHCYLAYVGGWGGTNTALFRIPAIDNHAARWNRIRACSLGTVVAWVQSYFPQAVSNGHGSAMELYSWRQSVIDSCYFWGFHPVADIILKCTYDDSSIPNSFNSYDTIRFNTFDNRHGSFTYGTNIPYEAIIPWGNLDSLIIYGNIFKYSGNTTDRYSTIYIAPWQNAWETPGYVEIYNNTFYNCPVWFRNANCFGANPQVRMVHNQFKYNICYNTSGNGEIGIDLMSSWDAIDSNLYYSTGTIRLDTDGADHNTAQWQAHGLDVHTSFTANPNFNNPTGGDFSRPTSSREMNRSYGGQTWTRYGAIQPAGRSYTISGTVTYNGNALSGATLTGLPGNPQTNASGYYIATVDSGWSGTARPVRTCYTFDPDIIAYIGVNSSFTGQDYIAYLDSTPPAISNVRDTSVTSQRAQIKWTTDESANSYVDYGDDTSYGDTSSNANYYVTNHTITLTGLAASHVYHYRVRSSDSCGNQATSGDYTFVTNLLTANTNFNVAPRGNITVSSTYNGYRIGVIANDTIAPREGTVTTWASQESATSPHWVAFDFINPVTVDSVRIYWAWNNAWMCSRQYRIQSWNDDNGTFADIDTINNSTADSSTTTRFVSKITATKIRYYQPPNMGPQTYPTVVWLTEIEIYADYMTTPYRFRGRPGNERGSIDLQWIAPGNDGPSGRASRYSIKYMQDTSGIAFNWDLADSFTVTIQPDTAGALQSCSVDSLQPGIRYFVAIKAYDEEAGNESEAAVIDTFSSETTTITPPLAAGGRPSAGEQVVSNRPTFTVIYNPNLAVVYFEVDDNSDFSSPIQSGSVYAEGTSPISWRLPDPLDKGGSYYWRASSDNMVWTAPIAFTVVLDIHAYPIPFRASEGLPGITFTNLPDKAKLTIATVSGDVVRSVENIGPLEWVWDVKNNNGRELASGVYLYVVNYGGGSTQGKIVVIR